jgi:hypothetical protein
MTHSTIRSIEKSHIRHDAHPCGRADWYLLRIALRIKAMLTEPLGDWRALRDLNPRPPRSVVRPSAAKSVKGRLMSAPYVFARVVAIVHDLFRPRLTLGIPIVSTQRMITPLRARLAR